MDEIFGFSPSKVNAFFISFNSLDKQRVAPIARTLVNMGYPVWYDHDPQAGTKARRERISEHIDICYAVLLFVTRGIFEPETSCVIDEYEEAIGANKAVIPVFLDDLDLNTIPPEYRNYISAWMQLQGVSFMSETPQDTARRIAKVIDMSMEIQEIIRRYGKNPCKSVSTSETAAPECQTQSDVQPENIPALNSAPVSIGSRVTFGSYPQSGSAPEPIVWRVLNVTDGKAIIISEELLDAHRFDVNSSCWHDSELRKWLNGDFINQAFSEDEQKCLCVVQNQEKLKITERRFLRKYTAETDVVSDDCLYCLSSDEAIQFFRDDEDRGALPTAYARKKEAWTDSDYGTGYWWLRSPGKGSVLASVVVPAGSVGSRGHYAGYDRVGIRPVACVELAHNSITG